MSGVQFTLARPTYGIRITVVRNIANVQARGQHSHLIPKIYFRRLLARTLPFQGGEVGSIPIGSTNTLQALMVKHTALTRKNTDRYRGDVPNISVSSKSRTVAPQVANRIAIIRTDSKVYFKGTI